MPTDQTKVAIVERNGGEIVDYEELSLAAENIYLSSSSFPQDNVKLALEEIVGSPGYIFGSEFYSAQDSSETSTTSNTVYSTKLTINPISLPFGNYLLSYSLVHRTSSANRETDIRVRDGSTTLFGVRSSLIRTQGQMPISGFIYLSGVSGNKTYTLEFKVGGNPTTSFVRDAQLAFWRVN